MQPKLLTPIRLQGLTSKNRIVMSPMCQYTVEKQDGIATDWHFVHYVSRAIGGVGLIVVEATAVRPEGRISKNDLGLWSDEQIPALRRMVDACHEAGALVAVQLGHAGRKAQDEAQPLAPSAITYPGYNDPRALTTDEVKQLVDDFGAAARRAIAAGFDTVEVHGAHGYLVHQFMSLLLNHRDDAYADPARFGSEVVAAMKAELPAGAPLLLRLSAIEYADGGYGLDHSLEVGRKLVAAGGDVLDISTGGEGNPGKGKLISFPGYQVPYARAFKEAFGLPTMTVGRMEDPALAEATVGNDDADMVAIGRGLLRDAAWPLAAELALTGAVQNPPTPYERAWPRPKK